MSTTIINEIDGFRLSRRSLLLGAMASAGALSLAGCVSTLGGWDPDEIYAAMPDERFPIPAVRLDQIDPDYYRTTVRYTTAEPVGTIVIDPSTHHLYLVGENGTATRYGINQPYDEFLWSGVAFVERKQEWPTWTPTPDQIGREPELRQYAGGMPPGIGNPLGARALYLYQNGRDTLCRIYGSAQEWTIGNGVSSGCFGLMNQDIIHLYNQVPLGTRVVILPRTA